MNTKFFIIHFHHRYHVTWYPAQILFLPPTKQKREYNGNHCQDSKHTSNGNTESFVIFVEFWRMRTLPFRSLVFWEKEKVKLYVFW
jgi:hypothetical protein